MNCTGKRCPMQYGKVDPATCTAVSYCPQATPPKTNADRIRAMTDEELAIWISALFTTQYNIKADPNFWADWLKEEVSE